MLKAWAPVIRKGYWEVELESVIMDAKDLHFTTKRAAIDTGKSPPKEKVKIQTQICSARKQRRALLKWIFILMRLNEFFSFFLFSLQKKKI